MAAAEDVRELLRDGVTLREEHGYLDAGADRPELAQTLGQRAMQSTLLPQIYEALWRPVGFTVLSGGRDAADEDGRLAEILALQPGDRVLDVACGPGNTTRRLAGLGEHPHLIVGADAAPNMLRRAVADTRDPRIVYVRADAVDLPFADGTFDAAACIGALYLIDEPYRALRELVRVLAPGGRLALLSSCYRGGLGLRLLARAVTAPGGVRMFSPHEITDALKAAGMVAVTRDIRGFTQVVGARKPA